MLIPILTVSNHGLMCIFLMINGANDVEHLFMCLFAIHTSFWQCLFKSFVHILSFSHYWVLRNLFCFFEKSLYILDLSLSLGVQFENISSQSTAFLVIIIALSFRKPFNFN